MPRASKERVHDLRAYLMEHAPLHGLSDFDAILGAAVKFGITRQAVNKHVRALVAEGLLTSSGNRRARRYDLITEASVQRYDLAPGLMEDVIWAEFARDQLAHLPRNAIQICQYGFTEMVNNAIDHSAGSSLEVSIEKTAMFTTFEITDDGVGIFRKIKEALGLEQEKYAVFELAKGKLTTDSSRHSGEGIFFTSRMFDKFAILSGTLLFSHHLDESDWLLEHQEETRGTSVLMTIMHDTTRTAKEVFDRYTEDAAFDISHVPLALAAYGEDFLVSRSQAKRIIARFDKFRKVVLDFKGVESIGQGFADELFRVFARQNPDVQLVPIRANDEVTRMIRRALEITL